MVSSTLTLGSATKIAGTDGRLVWPLGLSIACQWQSGIVLIPGGLCFAPNVLPPLSKNVVA